MANICREKRLVPAPMVYGRVVPLTAEQGISLSVEQYKALLRFIPEINAQLRKEGESIEEATQQDAEDGEIEKPAVIEKSKKPAAKKANIEATSDEDSA